MKSFAFAFLMLFISFPALAAEPLKLKQVEAEYVCMVNDTVFTEPQIEVPVGDKIYYGCCSGCVGLLQGSDEYHTAIDPVSGKDVDKASAVIGVSPDLQAYYFENIENLKAYTGTQPKGTDTE